MKLENDLAVFRAQITEQRRKAEDEAEQLLEEHKRRHQKELENIQKELEDAVLNKDRAERARRKLQEEVCVLFTHLFFSWLKMPKCRLTVFFLVGGLEP